MTTPTRAELLAAAENARDYARQAAHEYGESCADGLLEQRIRAWDALIAALDAYGAACQALGEYDGREAEKGHPSHPGSLYCDICIPRKGESAP